MQEYDEGRIWFKKRGKILTVGITEKVLEEIGTPEGVSLPVPGDECFEEEVVGEIEGDKASFELIAPADGVVVEVNDAIETDIEVLEVDPLDEGWIYRLKLSDADEEESEDEMSADRSNP